MGNYYDNINISAEMDFISQFAKSEEISKIEYKLQKICSMLGLENYGNRIDCSRNIFRPGMLSTIEYAWCSKILKEHSCDSSIYKYLGCLDSSLYLGNYKFIYAEDLENFTFLPYFHEIYNHLDDKFDNVTLILIGKDALESRKEFINLFETIITNLIEDYISKHYKLSLVNFGNSFGSRIDDNTRYLIDITIVIYRLLDAVVDLKFEDFEYITIDDETFKDVYHKIYDYAIKTNTSDMDYCNLINELYDEYFLEGFI